MGRKGRKVSRSKSETGISLQLGSKWELRYKGGRGPFQTAAIAVCTQMTPTGVEVFSPGRGLGLVSSSAGKPARLALATVWACREIQGSGR